MPDPCRDCTRDVPISEDPTDGRCPGCDADHLAREAARRAAARDEAALSAEGHKDR